MSIKMGSGLFFALKHAGSFRSIYGKSPFALTKQNFCAHAKIQQKISETVEPFGTLQVTAENADLYFKPTDPNSVTSLETSQLSLSVSDKREIKTSLSKTASKGIYSLNVIGAVNEKENQVTCTVEAPIKYDLQIHSKGPGQVNIGAMESSVVNVTTEVSDISARSLKSEEISLVTQSGNVTWKGAVLGNVHIVTQDGNVQGERLQGLRAHIATQSGNIELQSVYSEESRFMSHSGNVQLRNLHRKSVIHMTEGGNLTISGLDGSIEATLNGGQHEIQISRLDQSSFIKCSDGNITLQLPQPCPFSLSIEASDIQLPPTGIEDFSIESNEKVTKAGSDICLSVSAKNGRIIVKYSDWIASLGLRSKTSPSR